MTLRCTLLVILMAPAIAPPAEAGIFGKKPAKAEPMARVPELLYQVKMDSNEKKRAAAATELREHDPQKFPELVSTLVDVLQNDKSATVRVEAAQSLGKIRPVSGLAGQALEHASQKDSNLRVRMQAWTSLRLYSLAGYNAKDAKKDSQAPIPNQPREAGLRDEIVLIPPPNSSGPNPNIPTIPVVSPTTVTIPAAPRTDIPRPLPSRPTGGFSTAVPAQPVRVTPPPLAPTTPPPSDGPALAPPR